MISVSVERGAPSRIRDSTSGDGGELGRSLSGWMTVPRPSGFSTFLIRMGIFLRMT